MIKYILSALFIALVALLSLFGVIWIAEQGIEKIERSECLQWQEDSSQLVGWYATGWQVSQCECYNIKIK